MSPYLNARHFLFKVLAVLWLASSIGLAQSTCPQVIKPKLIDIQSNDTLDPKAEETLTKASHRAIQFFTQHVSNLQEPIKIYVGDGKGALRTGYDPKTDTVYFPAVDKVKNFGLESEDIIHHEIFHALVCRINPASCLLTPDTIRIHEALADYFAYNLNPDLYFGENYYLDKKFLRIYKTQLRISLSDSSYAQANAIVSYLIRHKISFDKIKNFLLEGSMSLERLKLLSPELTADIDKDLNSTLEVKISNYASSAQNRYRLKMDLPLVVSFIPNTSLTETAPNLRFIWETEGKQTVHIQQLDFNQFSVQLQSLDIKSSKYTLQIFSGDQLLGFKSFYFGPSFQ